MKHRISETEVIAEADIVASLLSGTGKHTATVAVRPVAYRAPLHLLAVVDAMAVVAKKSRNSMLNLLLQVGIDEVREKLDDDVIEKLSIEEAKAIQALDGQPSESVTE